MTIGLGEFALKEVHRRGTDKAGYKQVRGVVVQVLGGVQLLEFGFAHHRDAVSHGHRFGLVVSHIDKGGLQVLVQLAQLRAGLDAQFGVKVGERLIEQEDFWFAHNSAADS